MATNSAERSAADESVLGPNVPQSIVLALVVVLAASAAAVALVTVGIHDPHDSDVYSVRPEYVTWAILAIGLVGVSVMGGVYSWPAWRDLRVRSTRLARVASYGLSAFITLCYQASPGLVSRMYLKVWSPPLSWSVFREVGLILLIALPSLPALSGLVMAVLLLSRKKLPWDGADGRVAITELLRIRGQLQRFLAVLAVVIGGNVLTLGALRRAMLSVSASVSAIPDVMLLLYGAMMTGLLALLFVPAYLAWQTRAEELRDELYPLPPDGRATHDWYIARADLDGLLNLKVKAGAAFITGLGLLAPFASSLISAVVTGSSN